MICENCDSGLHSKHIKIINGICIVEVIFVEVSSRHGKYLVLRDGKYLCKDGESRLHTNFHDNDASGYYKTFEDVILTVDKYYPLTFNLLIYFKSEEFYLSDCSLEYFLLLSQKEEQKLSKKILSTNLFIGNELIAVKNHETIRHLFR